MCTVNDPTPSNGLCEGVTEEAFTAKVEAWIDSLDKEGNKEDTALFLMAGLMLEGLTPQMVTFMADLAGITTEDFDKANDTVKAKFIEFGMHPSNFVKFGELSQERRDTFLAQA